MNVSTLGRKTAALLAGASIALGIGLAGAPAHAAAPVPPSPVVLNVDPLFLPEDIAKYTPGDPAEYAVHGVHGMWFSLCEDQTIRTTDSRSGATSCGSDEIDPGTKKRTGVTSWNKKTGPYFTITNGNTKEFYTFATGLQPDTSALRAADVAAATIAAKGSTGQIAEAAGVKARTAAFAAFEKRDYYAEARKASYPAAKAAAIAAAKKAGAAAKASKTTKAKADAAGKRASTSKYAIGAAKSSGYRAGTAAAKKVKGTAAKKAAYAKAYKAAYDAVIRGIYRDAYNDVADHAYGVAYSHTHRVTYYREIAARTSKLYKATYAAAQQKAEAAHGIAYKAAYAKAYPVEYAKHLAALTNVTDAKLAAWPKP
ncbi:hypothetical protein ACX8Z9_04670 [Arthrobacter halodurans]|uniref:Uncharacterized protein n=1 Tax=Arthrobacter halodurans TaxID=516699 RepID=A0ABV4UR39_9MICC